VASNPLFYFFITLAALAQQPAPPEPHGSPAPAHTQSAPSTPQSAPPAAARKETAREILDEALHDKNPDVRKQAVIALSLIGPHEPYLSTLDSMLADKDVEVKLAAIASLVDLKSKHTVESLRKALDDDVPEVSFAAAKALYNLHDPRGREALFSVLSGETKAASGFLTRQKRDTLRMMHTPRTMFLFAMQQGMGFVPVPGLGTGVASMQGLLSDPGVSGRATAALLLGREKDRDTLAALRDALSDKDWSVRAAAVHSLALRNERALQKDIVPLLEDKKEAVRLRAAAAYLRLSMIKPAPRTQKKT
jgi:HEAT repeat protein